MQLFSNLDCINNNILQALCKNGRISNIELAEQIGLSPSACLRRTQELERSGIIKGYRAELDYQALGKCFSAYIAVGLSNHTIKSQQTFEKAIREAPDVLECHNITGAYEYLLRVEVTDLNAYKVFHSEVLSSLLQISTITTFVVIDSPKNNRG